MTVRVRVPDHCLGAVLDGKNYAAHNGVAELPGTTADYSEAKSQVLPSTLVGFSHTDLAELRCTNPSCRRKKMAFMGPVCGWCGSECEEIEEREAAIA